MTLASATQVIVLGVAVAIILVSLFTVLVTFISGDLSDDLTHKPGPRRRFPK